MSMAALQRIYADQKGKIRANRTSERFPIKHGTKQGDLVSSALFNAVLQHCLSEPLDAWKNKRYGVKFGEDRVTYLRFADDILILGSSVSQINQVIGDAMGAAEKIGLQPHGKNKVLSNGLG